MPASESDGAARGRDGGAVRILTFVNHVSHHADIEHTLATALEWGVDYIVAQGTGSDWGPYWLGSGEMPAADLRNNLRPYLRVCVEQGIPFILSLGVAGGRPHLELGLEAVSALCEEEGWRLRIGVLDTEIDPERLAGLIEGGRIVPSAYDVPDLSPQLSAEEARGLTRAVGLAGPEPIMDLLAEDGVDGVIAGRALDIGLIMAPLMARGIPRAVAAYAGKLLECAGFALTPNDSANPMWASVDAEGVTVRAPAASQAATVRGLACHSFYERSDPNEEDNPGGRLDVTDCRYEELPDGAVRCTGARWIDAPYTVLIEGAGLAGYRSFVIMGVRDPLLLSQWQEWVASMRRDVAAASRFDGIRHEINVRTYGIDPERPVAPTDPIGPERAFIVDVVAESQEMADSIAYFAFMRMYIGPYPGRKTTAGNCSIPFMPLVQAAGPVYRFVAYHLLPLEHPSEVFEQRIESLPYVEAAIV